MITRKVFIFVIVLVALMSAVEFLIFPNLYSTAILLAIIALLLYAYIYILKEEKIKKDEMDYFHLVVHELKNPLTSMRLSLKMLVDGSFGQTNHEQKDILEQTEKKNETLINLVDGLLDYSKFEAQNKYSKSLVDVIDVIEKIIVQNKREIESKRIEFHVAKPASLLPQIMADKNKITVAMQNLIENAIHYTPMGGKIEVSILQDKEYLNFKISDTGIGIPDDQKEKVFDKFFRAKNAIKTEVPGSGLGLYIVKKIIMGHKGKIWFDSKEHYGSTFYFKIPVE